MIGVLSWLVAWLVTAWAGGAQRPGDAVVADALPPVGAEDLPEGLEAITPQACGACHQRIYAAWAASRHAVSVSNAVFDTAWRHWPNGWCLQCHAPGRDQQISLLGQPAVPGGFVPPPESPPPGRWQHGVDCAACHVRDGMVLSAAPPTELAQQMHPSRHEPRLADARACAGCHDFPLQRHTPPWPFTLGPTPAQDTVHEWATSRHAADDRPCQACHMAEHGHRMPGAHEQALVRSAIRVEVSREANALVVALSSEGAGHAVPTGDPFRRLVFEACPTEACAQITARATARRQLRPEGGTWVLHEDRRIPPPTTDDPPVRILRAPLTGEARWWRLAYHLGDPRFADQLDPADISYLIHQGPLPEPP